MFEKPDPRKNHPKIMVFGPAGSGKTAFGLSAACCDDKPLAIIDTEAGSTFMSEGYLGPDGLVTNPNVTTLHTQDPTQVLKALDFLERNSGKYCALLVDSASVIWEMAQDSYFTHKGRIRGGDWNAIKLPVKRAYHRMMALDMPVVMTCRQKTNYAEFSSDRVSVDASDPFAPDFEKNAVHVFDVVLRLWRDKTGFHAVVHKSRIYEWPEDDSTHDGLTYPRVLAPMTHRFGGGVSSPFAAATAEGVLGMGAALFSDVSPEEIGQWQTAVENDGGLATDKAELQSVIAGARTRATNRGFYSQVKGWLAEYWANHPLANELNEDADGGDPAIPPNPPSGDSPSADSMSIEELLAWVDENVEPGTTARNFMDVALKEQRYGEVREMVQGMMKGTEREET